MNAHPAPHQSDISTAVNKKSGFTLIEMSVVLVVLATLVFMGVSTADLQRTVAVSQATDRNLEVIARALQQFQRTQGRYPCPALMTDASTTASYGMERGMTPSACHGAHASNNAYIGFVPFRTLGIEEHVAYDGWDRRVMYVIDKGHVASSTFGLGSVQVAADVANSRFVTNSQNAGSAIFVLVSHGEKGIGAYNRMGALHAPCSTGTLESRNCTLPATASLDFIPILSARNLTADVTNALYYDDYMLWRGQEQVQPVARTAITNPDQHPISVGLNFNCLMTREHHIYCSGMNNLGQLGRCQCGIPISSPSFVRERTNGSWRTLAPSGYSSMCAITQAGGARCWGEVKRDGFDKLYSIIGNAYNGTGASYTADVNSIAPHDNNWRNIAVGMYTGCGLRSDGAVCWGMGGDMSSSTPGHNEAFEANVGALGRNMHENSSVSVPTNPPSLDNDQLGWEMITTGGGCTNCSTPDTVHVRPVSCGIKKGRAYCWGSGSSGQLGNGTWSNSTVPVQVGSESDWRYIRTSGTAVCGIRGTGRLFCWGRNGSGQVGDGNSDGTTTVFAPSHADVNIPKEVRIAGATFDDWTFVATGTHVTCGIRGSGLLYCWGQNRNNFMSLATAPNPAPANDAVFTPVQIAQHITDWRYVATNLSDGMNHERYGCAVRSTGQYYCWGINQHGEFGGTNVAGTVIPAVGATIHPVTEIEIRNPSNRAERFYVKVPPR
ncbi:MAG: prepilin-type N-terminal cleavage/methylation domain-containing protein [Alphaproteobacteria bacterium]|nr:MAG: prepilin-type N-terminal cleavage/methylation domain-containing protein [Alphaproteobacteria bacterium]TAF76950.1 MAG: prepilin-type N-terminal cleavage/methylation domain-containing protein [Alphaproteobacteria bacterium]